MIFSAQRLYLKETISHWKQSFATDLWAVAVVHITTSYEFAMRIKTLTFHRWRFVSPASILHHSFNNNNNNNNNSKPWALACRRTTVQLSLLTELIEVLTVTVGCCGCLATIATRCADYFRLLELTNRQHIYWVSQKSSPYRFCRFRRNGLEF